MIRAITPLTAALFLFALCMPHVAAQEPHNPEITVAHKGVAELKADIKFLLDLVTDDPTHWENWNGMIEFLVFGLDFNRPLRVDILSGLTPPPLMIYGPYAEPLSDLLDENLGSEYVLQKRSDTLYEMLPTEQGWFLILEKQKYGILAPSTPKNHDLLKQLILKATNPLPVIEKILEGDVNIGIQLANSTETEEDIKKRRDSFAEIRAVELDALQKRPDESQTEFELRKGAVSNNLNELERLMVESKLSGAKAILDKKSVTAKVLFFGEAIPETSMARGIEMFNKQIDAFATAATPENSALSFRINHPIDELRSSNTLSFIELMRADIKSRIDAGEKMTAEQKEAALQLFDGIMTLVKDGVASENINGFIESVPTDAAEFTSHGAIVVKDAKRLDDTLVLLGKTGSGNEVTVGVETVGNVTIHKIKLGKGFLKIFDDVFGEEAEVLIGTSENMVWFGSGPNALAALKAGIESLKEPAESDVILRSKMQLLPWAKRAQRLIKDLPPPKTLDGQQSRRDKLLRLTQAVDTLKEEDDDTTFDVQVKDGKVSGEIFFNSGILRFAGTQLVKFSQDNLQ